jgi:AhpD family alkylhydroperoxidase
MPQPDHISKLGVPDPAELDDDLQQIFTRCVEKLGFVPNVLASYSLRPQRLRNFMATYNEIMLSPSGLSKLEREMVAVVVSSANRCYYCLVAHGAAVRVLSGDPELGEKLTTAPHLVDDSDRDALSQQGLSQEDIFDLSETVAFFNLSNRMAYALDMIPNREYHGQVRP